MTTQGEVSLQEIFALVETAKEYLGPMWVKKNMKQAANLPVKGIINRKQLALIHPLGLLFREAEKNRETLEKGKPLAHAANLLLLAGLGRNLKSLADVPGFDQLVEQLKLPAPFSDAALLAEISAHWQKLGYTPNILSSPEGTLTSMVSNQDHAFCLYPRSYTFLPGAEPVTSNTLTIPGNFIFSSWWEEWAADAAGQASNLDPEVAAILKSLPPDQRESGSILYLDLPPFTQKETFLSILATVGEYLQGGEQLISAVIICLAQHLPNLYVRHTLPVFNEKGAYPLTKSLLNTLSY